MSTAPATTPGRMTAEEFCHWASSSEQEGRWFELVRGVVIELPPPKRPHGRICANVAFELNKFVRKRRKGYVVTNDAGVILERDPDTVRGPDVAVYEDEDTFDEMPAGYAEIPPVLVVEVLSPSDRADQITRKLTDYLQNGVQMVWLVDPATRTVSVYQPGNSPGLVQGRQVLTGGDVLPGLKVRLATLFPPEKGRAGRKPDAGPKRRRS